MKVGNVAHGAGAVLGAVIALAFRAGWLLPASAAAVALVLAALAGATVGRPWVNTTTDGARTEARLGYDALEAKDPQRAVVHLRHAVRMDPNYAGGWVNLGIALVKLDRLTEAREAFATAARLDPNDEDARLGVKQIDALIWLNKFK